MRRVTGGLAEVGTINYRTGLDRDVAAHDAAGVVHHARARADGIALDAARVGDRPAGVELCVRRVEQRARAVGDVGRADGQPVHRLDAAVVDELTVDGED